MVRLEHFVVGHGARLGLIVLASAIATLLPIATSSFAAGPGLLFKVEGSGAAGESSYQLVNPRGIALLPNGDAYVGDGENNRVSVFSATGRFLRTFGGGVADGSSEEGQICTRACSVGSVGGSPGQFNGPRGIAVDSQSFVYVVDEENFRIQKFTPEGVPLLMIGGGVNRSTGGNLCTVASGDRCGSGTQGEGSSEFRDWDAGNFVAVGPHDVLYVGDKGRIQKFSPDGHYLSELKMPKHENVGSLAVDTDNGDVYFAYSQFWTDDYHIYRLTRTGRELCRAAIPGPLALALNPAGEIYAISDREGFESPALEPRVVRISRGCTPQGIVLGGSKGTTLNSLAVDGRGRLYVGSYASETSQSAVSVYAAEHSSWWERPIQRLTEAIGALLAIA